MKAICDVQRQKIVVYANDIPIVCQNDGDLMDIPGLAGAKIKCPELNIICPE